MAAPVDPQKNQNGHGLKALPSGQTYIYPANDCPLHCIGALMEVPKTKK